MSADFEIEKALIASVRSLSIPELAGVKIEEPNTTLEEAVKASLWLKASIVRGETVPITLGVTGEDDHNGFLQVDVNVPVNTGVGLVSTIAGKVKQAYPAGKKIGSTVVARSSVTSGRVVGGWYRLSVTIYFYSRIARNA